MHSLTVTHLALQQLLGSCLALTPRGGQKPLERQPGGVGVGGCGGNLLSGDGGRGLRSREGQGWSWSDKERGHGGWSSGLGDEAIWRMRLRLHGRTI